MKHLGTSCSSAVLGYGEGAVRRVLGGLGGALGGLGIPNMGGELGKLGGGGGGSGGGAGGGAINTDKSSPCSKARYGYKPRQKFC